MDVGIAVLLCGQFTSWIPALDYACVQAAASNKEVQDFDPSSGTISSHTLAQQPQKSRGFQRISVTDDPDRTFETSPPSPLDYAVLLQSLRNRGYNHVLLTTRMTWDDEPGIEARALSDRLALFKKSVIALPVTRGATAHPLPAPLVRALIPFDQIKGDHQLIPTVNQVTLPTHVDGGEQTFAGFHRIESTPSSPDHIPMLAHWPGQGLIPSIELLAIMINHDIDIADLLIDCGQHIRLGQKGPVIPLDIYGQTPVPKSPAPATNELAPLTAAQLISLKPTSPEASITPIGLIHATGKNTSPTNTLHPTRLTQILTLSKTFLIPEKTTHYRKLPLWANMTLLLTITLAACWGLTFHPINSLLTVTTLAILLFPLLLAFMHLTHHWFGLSAPLASLISAYLIPIRHRKRTTPIQKYRTSKPKPVIRP